MKLIPLPRCSPGLCCDSGVRLHVAGVVMCLGQRPLGCEEIHGSRGGYQVNPSLRRERELLPRDVRPQSLWPQHLCGGSPCSSDFTLKGLKWAEIQDLRVLFDTFNVQDTIHNNTQRSTQKIVIIVQQINIITNMLKVSRIK